jgi:hypothetical protein
VSLEGGNLSEKEGDLGHRPLPAGEHLGIADRAVERKEHQRQGDRRDLVLTGLAWLQSSEVALGGGAGISGRWHPFIFRQPALRRQADLVDPTSSRVLEIGEDVACGPLMPTR